MNKVGSIFIIAALIMGSTFIGVGAMNCIKANESVPITAYIEEIETYRGDDDIEHEVYVSFVNPDTEELQERRLNFYNSSMREGQELALMYHSESGDIIDKGMSIIFLVIGIFILLIFGGVGVGIVIGEKRQQKTKSNGIIVVKKKRR